MKVCVYQHVASDSIDNYFRYVYIYIYIYIPQKTYFSASKNIGELAKLNEYKKHQQNL